MTNSSSVGTTIVVALKKGKDLGEMLENIGLSSDFTLRFEDKYGFNEDELKRWVEDDFLDTNIYDLQEDYELLQAYITTHGYGGEIEDVDHSDFRKKFYDKTRIDNLPINLVGKDFILLHKIGEGFEYEHELKEDIKNRIWLFIEQLKKPGIDIEPRQPQTYEVRKNLDPNQKEVIEELEQMIETRIPIVKTLNIGKIEDFLASDDKFWGRESLIPNIEGFKIEGQDIVALGFHFRMNNQDPKILPISIDKFKRLKMLDLGFYHWIETPEIFGNPKSVEILIFPHYSKFKTPPESLGKMTALKRLLIRDCKGKILPKPLGNLKELEVLILRSNNDKRIFYNKKGEVPTEIPETIGKLKSLVVLDLGYNNIDTIPDSLGDLSSLKYLDLSGNYLSTLTKSIGNLKELKQLQLYGNQLTSLPFSFGELRKLEKCNLSSNQLCDLPASIGNLGSLQNLVLSDNNLKVLPEKIGYLKSLTDLNLEKNDLECLPDTIGTLSSLRSLNLDHTKLKTLPESIGKLTMLNSLRISDSLLEELPESIGNLKNLKNLSVTSNSLKKLPDSIGKLHTLESLFIFRNELEELPETIGDIYSLETILMSNNPLNKLPVSLLKLKSLKSIWISQNQMSTFLKEPTTSKIINELKKNGVYLRVD